MLKITFCQPLIPPVVTRQLSFGVPESKYYGIPWKSQVKGHGTKVTGKEWKEEINGTALNCKSPVSRRTQVGA